MKTIFKTLLIILAAFSLQTAAETAVPAFNNGDRIVCVGDSITHGGLYLDNILLFYATRFPDRDVKMYNCGISGDTAPGVIARFEPDVAVYHANIATVMLGMNDVGRDNFGKDKTSPEYIAAQEKSYKVYTESMDKLAALLTAKGCKIIFITPSIYDQTAQIETPSNFGVNDGLKRFADSIPALAKKYNGSVVDFNAPMTRINDGLQKENPSATVIGADRVHPGPAGHLLMSYLFLKAQQMPEYVSGAEFDAAGGQLTGAINCRIEAVDEISQSRISFVSRESALPFPVTAQQQPALAWAPFQQELNRQMLTVKNLAAGSYKLAIDGISVGTYSSDELATGVNLSANAKTPQYQQALKVKAVNDRARQIAQKLRTIAHIRYKFLAGYPTLPEDDEALRTILYKVIENARGKPWYNDQKKQCDEFIANRRSENDLRRQLDGFFAEIGQVNKPGVHRWTITPAGN